VLTPDDELLLYGGEGGNGLVTASGVAWRGGARNAQKALPLLPSGRAWHTVTRLADGRVLVLGGSDERNGTFAAGAALYE
jgi:hypothetical protein